NAIDVRKLFFLIKSELSDHRDLLSFMAGAHAGRHDQDEVARSHAAIRPAKSHERGALVLGSVDRRRRMKLFLEVAHHRNIIRHVVVRNVFAFPDTQGSANRLPVLSDEFTGGNVAGRETMSGWNRGSEPDRGRIRQGHFQIRKGLLLYYCDVVLRIHDDRELADG